MEDINLNLDLEQDAPVELSKGAVQQTKTTKKKVIEDIKPEVPYVACLRNETIVVRYIPRESGMITNPKHVFYGGMSENATRTFTVPILESSGRFKNVLTNEEKAYLEEVMGLEYNTLSIYKKDDNFWENYTVRLTKGDTFLDLSDPNDYIKYKVLLANSDFVAASLAEL